MFSQIKADAVRHTCMRAFGRCAYLRCCFALTPAGAGAADIRLCKGFRLSKNVSPQETNHQQNSALSGRLKTLYCVHHQNPHRSNLMKLPVLFLGHGNPMNAIEHTVYSESWQRLGKALRAQYGGKIRAILAVSAHWVTRGSAVTAMEKPRTIHDFGGFPQALFDAQYPAPGSPEVAAEIRALLGEAEVAADLGWGLDHGGRGLCKTPFPSLLRRQEPSLKRSFSCRAGSRHQNMRNQIFDFIGFYYFQKSVRQAKRCFALGTRLRGCDRYLVLQRSHAV
jgi:hypothetical protein